MRLYVTSMAWASAKASLRAGRHLYQCEKARPGLELYDATKTTALDYLCTFAPLAQDDVMQ